MVLSSWSLKASGASYAACPGGQGFGAAWAVAETQGYTPEVHSYFLEQHLNRASVVYHRLLSKAAGLPGPAQLALDALRDQAQTLRLCAS